MQAKQKKHNPSHQEEEKHLAWHFSTAIDSSHYNALPFHYCHKETGGHTVRTTKMDIKQHFYFFKIEHHWKINKSLLTCETDTCQQGWSMLRLSFQPQWQNQRTQWGHYPLQSLHRRQLLSPSKKKVPVRVKKNFFLKRTNIFWKSEGEKSFPKTMKQTINLNWHRRGGINEGAAGEPSSSTRVSQESDRGKSSWEHAGPDWREHSGGTPGYFLGLVRHNRWKWLQTVSYCIKALHENVFRIECTYDILSKIVIERQ